MFAASLIIASPPAAAEKTTTTKPAKPQNAALSYWQAFALLPGLTRSEKKVLREHASAPMDKTTEKIIKKSAAALKMLRRGAGIKHCDWGLDKKAGVAALVPHLPKARQMARLACLAARYHLHQGKQKAAVDDLMAALALSHHLGEKGPLVGFLVQVAIESIVVETTAKHLRHFSPATLKILGKRISAVPAGGSLASALRHEKDFLIDQKNNPFYKQAIELNAELAKIADLSPDEFAKKIKTIKNPLIKIQGPVLQRSCYIYAAVRAKTAMLKAAIAIRLGGKDKIKSTKDPYGDGPFRYKATKEGFELSSKLMMDGKPVTLTVGKAAQHSKERSRRK